MHLRDLLRARGDPLESEACRYLPRVRSAAQRRLGLVRPPLVLVIHINRSYWHPSRGVYRHIRPNKAVY